MLDESLLLFLFLALLIGWSMGRFGRTGERTKVPASPDQTGKHRLQLLFDSYSDEALDSFIHGLEVNSETLGLHISIGKHFRTEGEVEKAIFIHQNLMSHPELTKHQTEPVVYELAKDYKAAGLFDRAESLLEQLLDSKSFQTKSRRLLLTIYELEKDWLKAAAIGDHFDFKKFPDIKTRVAQYYCELAEEDLALARVSEPLRYYRKALKVDKHCARAQLALARTSLESNDIGSSVQRLRDLISGTPEYLELALPLLLECTKRSNTFAQYREYLEQLYRESGNVNVLLAVFGAYREEGDPQAGLAYLEQEMIKRPNLSVLHALLQGSSDNVDTHSERLWQVLSDVIARIQDSVPAYRCHNCGFETRQMHWLCPSCKSWESIKPYSEPGMTNQGYAH